QPEGLANGSTAEAPDRDWCRAALFTVLQHARRPAETRGLLDPARATTMHQRPHFERTTASSMSPQLNALANHEANRERSGWTPQFGLRMDSFLVGAWTRSRLVVDGSRCVDQCQVLWLQTPSWYADIRVPCRDRLISEAGPEAVFARPG